MELNALAILVVILFLRLLFVEIRSIKEDPRKHPFVHSASSSSRSLAETSHHAEPSKVVPEDTYFSDRLVINGSTAVQGEQQHEEQDEYSTAGVYEDDEEGALARIERALVAPVQLIGSIPALRPGHTIHTVEGKDQKSFPKGSIVLITEVGRDFYRGLMVNLPLPETERVAARKALRIAGGQTDETPPLSLNNVVFYGNGGPVRTVDERWAIIHDNTRITGALVLGESLAIGGSVQEILSDLDMHVILLYG